MVILYVVWGLASSEVLWGVGIVSSQVFGHLRSFKGWIQTEACVIPSYHGMLIRNRETNRDIISVAVVPPKQQLFVQPKLKNNNVHLIRYNCSTRLWMHCMNAWLKRCVFTFTHLADTFIQSDLHCIQVTVLHLISSCFPWESYPWSWRC